MLARLAPETGQMRLKTSMLLLPLLNPVDVDENVVTLDHITHGRLDEYPLLAALRSRVAAEGPHGGRAALLAAGDGGAQRIPSIRFSTAVRRNPFRRLSSAQRRVLGFVLLALERHKGMAVDVEYSYVFDKDRNEWELNILQRRPMTTH